MNLAKATLTIAGRTFNTGDQVETPDGAGTILSIDPFCDQEILVRFADEHAQWYAYQVVVVRPQEAP